jgi:hypothetical protein
MRETSFRNVEEGASFLLFVLVLVGVVGLVWVCEVWYASSGLDDDVGVVTLVDGFDVMDGVGVVVDAADVEVVSDAAVAHESADDIKAGENGRGSVGNNSIFDKPCGVAKWRRELPLEQGVLGYHEEMVEDFNLIVWRRRPKEEDCKQSCGWWVSVIDGVGFRVGVGVCGKIDRNEISVIWAFLSSMLRNIFSEELSKEEEEEEVKTEQEEGSEE